MAVEPPDLETRVAILMKKAEQSHISLAPDAAFFIAQRIRSNVRELEGALKRVIASANFTGRPFDVELIKDSLKDSLAAGQAGVVRQYQAQSSRVLQNQGGRSDVEAAQPLGGQASPGGYGHGKRADPTQLARN